MSQTFESFPTTKHVSFYLIQKKTGTVHASGHTSFKKRKAMSHGHQDRSTIDIQTQNRNATVFGFFFVVGFFYFLYIF